MSCLASDKAAMRPVGPPPAIMMRSCSFKAMFFFIRGIRLSTIAKTKQNMRHRISKAEISLLNRHDLVDPVVSRFQNGFHGYE